MHLSQKRQLVVCLSRNGPKRQTLKASLTCSPLSSFQQADQEPYANRYNPSSSSYSTLYPPPFPSRPRTRTNPGVDRSSFGSLRSNDLLQAVLERDHERGKRIGDVFKEME
jgi:hypothetical protein